MKYNASDAKDCIFGKCKYTAIFKKVSDPKGGPAVHFLITEKKLKHFEKL